jgi:hypothetical protein
VTSNRKRKRSPPRTYRAWLKKRIDNARVTARAGRYAETRKIAAMRAEVYAGVLREMELTGADLLERFRRVS